MCQAQSCSPVGFPVFKAVLACAQSLHCSSSFSPGSALWSCAAPLLHSRQCCSATTPQQILLLPGGKLITISVPPASLKTAAGGPFSSKQMHCAGSPWYCCAPIIETVKATWHRTSHDPELSAQWPRRFLQGSRTRNRRPSCTGSCLDLHLLRG